MEFEVVVGLTPDITSGTVDGEPAPMTPNMRSFDVTKTYSSYADAIATAPLTFEFFAGTSLVFSGRIAPGFCKRECVNSSCPAWMDVVHETVRIPSETQLSSDFTGCFDCWTAKVRVGGCP